MIISKTPLRASFFGGGSDFKDYFEKSTLGYGQVLSATLDMHVYITLNKKQAYYSIFLNEKGI